MRITPETLLKIARDTVNRRTRSDRDLLAIYLDGSLLENDPLLGGTVDIDLVFVHNEEVTLDREIQPLTDEVHLDIAHHTRSTYQHARELRLHPWLGPTVFGCKILYDPQHFMDFTQAGVRSQFNRPDNVLARARSQAEHAREMWLALHNLNTAAGLRDISLYLKAVEHAANAITSLSGSLLTERRFLSRFPARAEVVKHPGLYPGLLGLLGAPNVNAETLHSWLPDWESTYKAIPPTQAPPRLHPARFNYYRLGFEPILQGEHPHDILWSMLQTWTRAIALLPPDHAGQHTCQEALQHLGLLGAGFAQRVAALDAYLDMVEEMLEEWGRSNGVEIK